MMKKAGDLIVTEEPFVHVLLQQERGKLCDFCFESHEDLKRCSWCTFVKYCSKACQKSDWRVHKLECQCLKNVLPKIPTDSVRLMLRIILRIKLDGETITNKKVDAVWQRRFQDLMSHTEDIKQDQKRTEQFAQIMFTLTQLVKDIIDLPPTTELLQIFGKMCINSFSICNGEMQAVGTGIYLGASKLDHSCVPNAVVTFSGHKAQVRAVDTIKTLDPNKIFISYVSQLATSEERQKQLMEQYYFSCGCSRCQDVRQDQLMLALACPDLSCTGPVIRNTEGHFLPCKLCGLARKEDCAEVDKVTAMSQEVLKKTDEARKFNNIQEILDMCVDGLKGQKNLFHHHNVFHVRVLDKAFDAAVDLGLWSAALGYGESTLHPYLALHPPNNPTVGVQFMKVGKLQLFLQKLQPALRSLQQAESIISITHGKSHSLYRQVSELLDQCMEELRMQLEHSS